MVEKRVGPRREVERAKSVMDGLMRSSKRQVRSAEGKVRSAICAQSLSTKVRSQTGGMVEIRVRRDGKEKGQALDLVFK